MARAASLVVERLPLTTDQPWCRGQAGVHLHKKYVILEKDGIPIAGARLLVTHNVRHFRSGQGVRVITPGNAHRGSPRVDGIVQNVSGDTLRRSPGASGASPNSPSSSAGAARAYDRCSRRRATTRRREHATRKETV